VSSWLDGVARPYSAMNIALRPRFVLRPLMLIATMAAALALGIAADATTAMAAFAIATWTTTLVQLILFSSCIARKVPAGPRRYDVSAWIKLSSPIFAVWAFYMLLTTPMSCVAPVPAAGRGRALPRRRQNSGAQTFIHFSVSAAVSHRFAAHHVAGDTRCSRRSPAPCAGRSGRRSR
jgi:hypothetical protein